MKCESCGCYDECEEVDGTLLCESCKQRRYETKEYVIQESNIRSMEKTLRSDKNE